MEQDDVSSTFCMRAGGTSYLIANFELTRSSLSGKHGLATLCNQSPLSSDTEWLCVDVKEYKIINTYKPLLTRLQTSDTDWWYNNGSAEMDSVITWTNSNNLALLNNLNDTASFHFGLWNTGTNPDLAFYNIGLDSGQRLPQTCSENVSKITTSTFAHHSI